MMTFLSDSLAIVGNGPAQLGKGTGPEIDAHRHVIRMNDWKEGSRVADYGLKTTAWATTFCSDIERRTFAGPIFCTLPLMEERFYSRHARHYPTQPDVLALANCLRFGEAHVIPLGMYEAIGRVSCGITLLYWIYRERGWSLRGVHTYGFSFFDRLKPHHYWRPSGQCQQHDTETERRLYALMMEGKLR